MDRPQSDLSDELAPPSADAQKMDEIRSDMVETRSALADKLDALQDKVLGTVEKTVETVQDTVAAARRTFDLRYQTEQHPWRMVGLAVLAGAAVDSLLGRSAPPTTARLENAPSTVGPCSANGTSHQAPPAPGPFAEEWQKLKGLAIGAGMALVRDWLKEAVPPLTEQIDELLNSTTTKIGGVPIEDPILSARTEPPARPRAWSSAG